MTDSPPSQNDISGKEEYNKRRKLADEEYSMHRRIIDLERKEFELFKEKELLKIKYEQETARFEIERKRLEMEKQALEQDIKNRETVVHNTAHKNIQREQLLNEREELLEKKYKLWLETRSGSNLYN